MPSHKRDGFRAAFHDFDFDRIGSFGARDVARLLRNERIVRHRGKIEAVINNARRARELVATEGSLAAHVWKFEPAPKDLAAPQTASISTASTALSKDLKKRGWTFVGPTTVHAFLQAMGLINDHAEGCAVRPKAERARRAFERPRGRH